MAIVVRLRKTSIIHKFTKKVKNLFLNPQRFKNKMTDSAEKIHFNAARNTSFAVVAVRCNDGSQGKRKLIPGDVYTLLQGYMVDADDSENHSDTDAHNRDHLNSLYDEYLNQDKEGQPHVIISALVGKNGSGKSSLVEFIMRLINNFAAKTFGEAKHGDASDRLHFIEGVNGDLWYVVDNQFYQLHIENAMVGLYKIPTNKCDDFNSRIFEDGNKDVKGYENILPRMGEDDLYGLFSNFFYSIISNYSIYAYNTNDFIGEWDTDEKERLISAEYPDQVFSNEERCWIHGLFHKNDGYQTPMVITPFRHEGEIHINSENALSRERLISLLINREEFRKINGHLMADGISCSLYDKREKDYSIAGVRKYLGFKHITDHAFSNIYNQIIRLWSLNIGTVLNLNKRKRFHKEALEYLVYKTLKISKTYRQHHHDYDLLAQTTDIYNPELVNEIVKSISKDFSHVTRKIYQTIAYIISDIYSGLSDERYLSDVITLEEINQRHSKWEESGEPYISGPMNNQRKQILRQQAIIPPPFLKSRILLHEEDKKKTRIDFESLSSGEKQQIYAVSSILYHLDNLDSVANDKSDRMRIQYRNIFVVLEEIELYFHPELQQGFIKSMLDGIKRLQLKNIKGIHMLLVTHSPYVLSDIPRSNVLALKSNGASSTGKLNTFCGNIHEMLKDSFFLSQGSQGFFAKWEIGFLMACLNIHKAYRETVHAHSSKLTQDLHEKEDRWYDFLMNIAQDETDIYRFTVRYRNERSNPITFDYIRFNRDFPEKLLKERIEIVDEPLVRSILQREFNMAFFKTEEEILRQEIEERERRLKKLTGEA